MSEVYLVSGVALSGNKGASGMTESLIRNLRERAPEARFCILSYYPRSDRALQEDLPDTELLDGSPMRVVWLFFVSIWAGLCVRLHLPHGWYAHGELGKIAQCTCWLDASGISFVDGREMFLVFNILTIFPALALKIPIIKVAQAMGPFNGLLNRLAAKLILPRLRQIVARGSVTRGYLDELGLSNVVNGYDVAFSLKVGEAERRAIAEYLPPTGRCVIGISPSQIVRELCKTQRIPYLETLRQCIEGWVEEGIDCVIFPHSARKGCEKTHNNDLPLMHRFAAMLPDSEHIRVVDEELSAGKLRMLISSCDLLVTSRFHAIISAMATGVPTVVIGWSHKYAEALAPFELDAFVIPYGELDCEAVRKRVKQIRASREELSERIRRVTSDILQENDRFFNRLCSR